MRTIRAGIPPSETVVAIALRHRLSRFLAATVKTNFIEKLVAEHQIRQNATLSKATNWFLANHLCVTTNPRHTGDRGDTRRAALRVSPPWRRPDNISWRHSSD
jgi:hypothetical protein